MNRRQFLYTGSVAGAAAAVPSIFIRRGRTRIHQNVSLLVRGGLVFSGDGSDGLELDVAIEGGRILAVAPHIEAGGAEVIDARGFTVAPGFIDIHSHTDLGLLIEPTAPSKLRQGVTTEVAGQDGSSLGPWSPDRLAEMQERYKSRFDIEIDFDDLPGFFERLRKNPPAVNFASMIGAGTVRGRVIGNADRPPTDDELARMVGYVQEAVDAGACGLSTGLEYIPGAFATVDELVALCQPLKEKHLPYASHMRNEDNQVLGAIEEALTIGMRASVPTHISHLKAQGRGNWWKAEAALDVIDRTAQAEQDVTFDRYPYVAYSTGLSSLFPVWSREGGTDKFLERLSDEQTAELIRLAVHQKISQLGDWNSVQITSTSNDSLAFARGRRLGDLAVERQVEPYELAVQLIRDDRSRTGMVGFGMSEENTARILSHPRGMICSDGSARAVAGPLSNGTPHPRTYGSFPRILGYYVREKKTMPLSLAIMKMTSMPAGRLRLSDRGQIAEGYAADVVVFDPDTVNDNATFEAPHQYPTGIPHVIVNGEVVLIDGEEMMNRPGQVLVPS